MFFRKKPKANGLFIRNFIFGVEDSLVSTVGLISGIAAAGVMKKEILLTGTVLIFVEAFSMGVGSLLSEHSAEEFEFKKEVSLKTSFDGGIIMFFSYLLAGGIPLAPYIFLPPQSAIGFSIVITLVALFALGAAGASISRTSIARHGFEMLILGGIAIAVGVAVGQFVKII